MSGCLLCGADARTPSRVLRLTSPNNTKLTLHRTRSCDSPAAAVCRRDDLQRLHPAVPILRVLVSAGWGGARRLSSSSCCLGVRQITGDAQATAAMLEVWGGSCCEGTLRRCRQPDCEENPMLPRPPPHTHKECRQSLSRRLTAHGHSQEHAALPQRPVFDHLVILHPVLDDILQCEHLILQCTRSSMHAHAHSSGALTVATSNTALHNLVSPGTSAWHSAFSVAVLGWRSQ